MTGPRTYCNPMPIPHYQRGKFCFDKNEDSRWQHDVKRDYREMADPTVIYFKGKWYLFPSGGCLWVSEDMVDWEFKRIEPFDPGYAPTVVQKGEYLYMTACGNEMWRAKDPLGPWGFLGNIKNEKGEPVGWADPMLFVDDDGSMYAYHGLGIDGIYGAKMKASDPTAFDGPQVHCFGYNPEHKWERFGEFNQDVSRSYIEGSWMTKHNGLYYLQYSAPGTELKNYSLGCYVSENPLGPFTYQEKSPILSQKGGLINGCGHHSVVKGPGGSLWCFYTLLVRIEHSFERRIGMDPVGFDEEGNMYVSGPSEAPQYAPGIKKAPERDNSADLLPLTPGCICRASSYLYGHEPAYAIDNNIRTWWETEKISEPQWLRVDLQNSFEVHSARIMFADRGLDYDKGIVPGPYKYRIEGSADGQSWFILMDKSSNTEEKHITYECWEPEEAREIRLVVLEAPEGMSLGVWEFTVFGKLV